MSQRESSNLEYKVNAKSDTFLKTVSAYANYGQGVIVFGVDNDGEIMGIKEPQKVCLDIENRINGSLKPVPKYSMFIDDAKRTITLNVSEGRFKPYLFKSKAYRRADSATVEVDRIEFNRLVLQGANQSFEEVPAGNQRLEFEYLKQKLTDRLGIKNVTRDILITLNLYSEHTGYNKAAELLSDQNTIPGIDIVRFGRNINELLDRETYSGLSLLEIYDKALALYRKYYKYELIKGSDRREMELIPEEAFREAMANAIVHRAWDVNSHILIGFHQEKIEIRSPGGLMAGLSRDEFLNGQISMLRNPIIGNVFFRLKYIEMFATGIKRIKYAYEDSLVKPEFNIYQNSIEIVLPIISTDPGLLAVDEQAIFRVLKHGVVLTRNEIQAQTKLSKAKTIRVLNTLIDKSIVEKIGEGRGTRYRHL